MTVQISLHFLLALEQHRVKHILCVLCPLRSQQCKRQQPLLCSLTPRKLPLDSHDVQCEHARLVGAQHVHSTKFLDGCQPRHNDLSLCQSTIGPSSKCTQLAWRSELTPPTTPRRPRASSTPRQCCRGARL